MFYTQSHQPSIGVTTHKLESLLEKAQVILNIDSNLCKKVIQRFTDVNINSTHKKILLKYLNETLLFCVNNSDKLSPTRLMGFTNECENRLAYFKGL